MPTRKRLLKDNDSITIRRTTSDNYFHTHSKAAVTSKSIYSELVAPLVESDTHQLAAHSTFRGVENLANRHEREFEQWLLETQEGFNIILYGYGSKHKLLTRLAQRCSTIGDAIAICSWSSAFNPEQILISIGQSHGLVTEGPSRSLDHRIQDVLSYCDNRKRPLFLIIDSLDAPSFNNSSAATLILSSLSRHQKIRIIGTIANVKAAHGWNLHGPTHTKQEVTSDPSSEAGDRMGRGFLWHDATTFEEYHLELDGRNLAKPPSYRTGRTTKAVLQRGTPITETAAHHILASVTERAKKLFLFIATKQLEQRPPAEEVKSVKDMPSSHPLPYATTFISARDSFLAQSDTQMKALLSEFTDHGLIILESGGLELESPGEVLWISMDWESLHPVVKELRSQIQS